MIDKRIGKRVKQARERLGITQEDLAEMCIRDSPKSMRAMFWMVCPPASPNTSRRPQSSTRKTRFCPVSYTHLDVYKRQALRKADGAVLVLDVGQPDFISGKINRVDSALDPIHIQRCLLYTSSNPLLSLQYLSRIAS